MPWDNRSIVEQRWLMLQRFFKEEAPVTKIAREFGVSRKTFYKFKHRFEVEGVAGLEDKSRLPHQRPHQALGNLPPISRYKLVQRQFPQPPVPIFYPQGSLLRKVRGNGCICLKGNEIFISHLLIGKTVKIEQNQKTLEIYHDKNLIKSVTCVS